MCAGAILQSRIERVVFAARSPRLGAAGSWVNLFNQDNVHPFQPNIEVSQRRSVVARAIEQRT